MLVYDIEIKKAILGRGEEPQEGVEYCEGWSDHEAMGVSTVCCYDYKEDRYRVFCEDNMGEFLALTYARDILVSFNGVGFDNKVLAHALPAPAEPLKWLNATPCLAEPLKWLNEKSYDIFAEIRDVSGIWCGLDATIKANGLGAGKTGNGALAPVWYQTGEWGRLIDYCLMDTKLTKQLFDVILAGNPITNPKTGQPMILRKPIKEGEK